MLNFRAHEVVRRSNSGPGPEGRPQIIHITPQNADKVISEITMPSWQVMKNRRKPFTFFVEGIVGAGKSTLLEPFKVLLKINISLLAVTFL